MIPVNWISVWAIASAGAAMAAALYVWLTYQLWCATAAHVAMLKTSRETELMLRLIREYDGLSGDIDYIGDFFNDCACNGPSDPVKRFAEAMRLDAPDSRASSVDESRFRVSRFFVRTRKLVRAGYLSERVVVAALDREAVQVFLEFVEPLNQGIAGRNYKSDDKEFFQALLTRYPIRLRANRVG
jgi:hypothetical protein